MGTKDSYNEGDVFIARHRFDVAKAVRASRLLSMGAKVAWEALFDRTWENRDYVQVAYDTIASDIGTSKRQAIRYVQYLVKAKLIRIQRQYRKGWQEVNRFRFLWRDPQAIRGDKVSPRSDKYGRMGPIRPTCSERAAGCRVSGRVPYGVVGSS